VVEHNLAKVGVASSNLVSRSILTNNLSGILFSVKSTVMATITKTGSGLWKAQLGAKAGHYYQNLWH
jgi:hypothetical protein